MDPRGSTAERCCCSVPSYSHRGKEFQQTVLEWDGGAHSEVGGLGGVGGGGGGFGWGRLSPSVRSAHSLQNVPERKRERER